MKHTVNTYRDQGCRCDECRAAWAAYTSRQRYRRGSLPLPEGREHGVYSTYVNYRCRCDKCRAAAAQRARENRARKVAQ